MENSPISPANLLNFSADLPLIANTSVAKTSLAVANNPFDLALQQVEQFDPFETPPSAPATSNDSQKVAQLIDFGDFANKENSNDLNAPKVSFKSYTSQSPTKQRTSNRDNLLKLSCANSAIQSREGESRVEVNLEKISEKWRDFMMEAEDSFQDIMKQEMNFVDSIDTDLSDYESELKIPALMRTNSVTKTDDSMDRKSLINKLNEIKRGKNKNEEMKSVAEKLRELAGDGEVGDLVNKLCSALDKSSESKENVPPPPMVRQATFEVENSKQDPQVQTVVEQLTKALGNVNMNVISSVESSEAAVAPTIIVVVNPSEAPAVLEPVTTPPQAPPQTSRTTKRHSGAYSVTPRLSNLRRSSSFSTPAVQKPPATVTGTPLTSFSRPMPRRSFITDPKTVKSKLPMETFEKPKLLVAHKRPGPSLKEPMRATVPLRAVVKPATAPIPTRQPAGKIPATPTMQRRTSLMPTPTPQRRTSLMPTPTPQRRDSIGSATRQLTPRPSAVNLSNRKSLLPPASTGTLTQRKFQPPTTPVRSAAKPVCKK